MDTSLVVASAGEAWRKYVSVGAIYPDLLRPHIFSAWERSHTQGATPWVARAEVLSSSATERLLDGQSRLVSAARPYMRLLSKAAGAVPHAAMLGTPDAIVLDVMGDERSVSGPERVPGPGSLLSEEACGSNGIGTPLAEGRYVEIVSTEHFIHGFQPFTCHGIPIETPEGEREGVLSVSVRRPESAERLREILVCAAHGVATELARLRLADRRRDAMAAGDQESTTIEALHRELVQLGVMPSSPPGGAFGRREAFQVIRLAGDTMRELEVLERAWRDLASDDPVIATQVELTREVSDLLGMLSREARRRRVEVVYRREVERLDAVADRHKLRREVFRLLLRGIDVADGGGAVTVYVGAAPSGGLCHVRVDAAPRPDGPGEPVSSSVVCGGGA